MAEAIHHEIHAPLEALDATAAPPALTPKRPQSAGAMTITLDDGPGSPTTPSIPSPWKRSAGGLGEKWCDKVERVRSSSPYGTLPGGPSSRSSSRLETTAGRSSSRFSSRGSFARFTASPGCRSGSVPSRSSRRAPRRRSSRLSPTLRPSTPSRAGRRGARA